ncbi:glycosyltransferase family 2 protein [Escherichia albertii]|uniref:glycosyltransferase family 2 protein n=1 Tax=Escherichia albertii TaxID=208962 RepID=UPI001374EFF1|nr:glycosyltransferase family 2 protein [Escherichia albertii]
MKKLVSVVMPTYNNEKYIKSAINDIVNQSYKNWELIIINDGSTDNTCQVLSEYNEIKNIHIINLVTNKGICEALNIGLKVAKGDFILRFDADDRCSGDRISKLLEYMLKNDIDIVGSSVITINENDDIIGKAVFSGNERVISRLIRYENPILHIWLAKREVYDKLGGYRIGGVEDYDFILRALDFGYKVSNISDYFGISIRKHSRNTANTQGWRQRKCFNLAWKLHKERLINGYEVTSSIPKYGRFIKCGDKIHAISNKLLVKGISSKNLPYKIAIIAVAAMISPYQLQYLSYRFIGKIIKKSYENTLYYTKS